MDESIRLLDESIAHWVRMREDRKCGEKPTGRYCALCERYYRGRPKCTGCPIANYAESYLCRGTPYEEAPDAFDDGNDEKWRAAADAEIEFLREVRDSLVKRRNQVNPTDEP